MRPRSRGVERGGMRRACVRMRGSYISRNVNPVAHARAS
jgi:hypothetical protein